MIKLKILNFYPILDIGHYAHILNLDSNIVRDTIFAGNIPFISGLFKIVDNCSFMYD